MKHIDNNIKFSLYYKRDTIRSTFGNRLFNNVPLLRIPEDIEYSIELLYSADKLLNIKNIKILNKLPIYFCVKADNMLITFVNNDYVNNRPIMNQINNTIRNKLYD